MLERYAKELSFLLIPISLQLYVVDLRYFNLPLNKKLTFMQLTVQY